MRVITNELIPVYETDTGEKVVDARELHDFLEVGRDFTRWIKDRIEKYGFYEESDYALTLTKTGERQNVTRHDYILKLDMAKEIAMVESNDKGSKARKYFIEVEKRFKAQVVDVSHLSPSLQMFKQLWDGLATKEFEDAKRDKKIQSLETGFITIQETIIQRNDDWRDSINKMFNSAVRNSSTQDFQSMRNESYSILEDRAKCDLARRQRNMRDRLLESGATKTKVNGITNMHVIESEPRLKEIYSSIVKEMSVRTVKIKEA